MHAPPTLLICSAIFGIIFSFLIRLCLINLDHSPASLLILIASFAIVPILIARVAYRQGYDHGISTTRSQDDKLNP